MTSLLINQRIPAGELVYDRRISRYRFAEGLDPVESRLIQEILLSEQSSLEGRLLNIADTFINGDLTVGELESDLALTIKESLIRIITLAAGGNDNLNRSPARRLFFIQLGLSLDRVFADIRRLVDRIQLGFTTELYFLDRVRRFSLEVYPFYSATEILRSIVEQGYNEARRSLEAGIKHCPQCPLYATRGVYVAIENIVPIGQACVCGGRCHCRLDFRFNPRRPAMTQERLLTFVRGSVRPF